MERSERKLHGRINPVRFASQILRDRGPRFALRIKKSLLAHGRAGKDFFFFRTVGVGYGLQDTP